MIKKRKKNPNTETYALSQYIYMSVHKAQRIIDQIRGRSYMETLMILELMPYQACYPILKLVYAAANASQNMGFSKADLVISKAEVNGGTVVKKLKPQARGRSYPTKKTTCHITIVLKGIPLYKYEETGLKNPNKYIKKVHSYDAPGMATRHSMYSNRGVWDKK
nr:ribosomal protein L22 [Malania oleifera]